MTAASPNVSQSGGSEKGRRQQDALTLQVDVELGSVDHADFEHRRTPPEPFGVQMAEQRLDAIDQVAHPHRQVSGEQSADLLPVRRDEPVVQLTQPLIELVAELRIASQTASPPGQSPVFRDAGELVA